MATDENDHTRSHTIEDGDGPKKFDLNMEEELLEAWEVSDGIREIIANALDESILSNTDKPDIYRDEDGRWHIRDYGRGLRHQDLTQGEDEEKLKYPDKVIGKFGVGLKDALAVLSRRNVNITVHSPHLTFTIEESSKAGFDDIETLHAMIRPPENPEMDGTDVILDGCSPTDIDAAKENFLTYNNDEVLEETKFGEVLNPAKEDEANIYVTGLKVATEEDFLFSYNITKTTKKINDALNRERSNVGRTAYRRRVQTILESCESGEVATKLSEDLERQRLGLNHEELNWKPIQEHAVKILNANEDVIFVGSLEAMQNKDVIEKAEQDGYRTVTIPDNVRNSIDDGEDKDGNKIKTVTEYQKEWEESFEFDWVPESDLSDSELEVWNWRNDVLSMVGVEDYIAEIRVSNTMRAIDDSWKTRGLWDPKLGRIVIHRDALESKPKFIAILLHEAAHAVTEATDQSREFEAGLSDFIGILGVEALGDNSDSTWTRGPLSNMSYQNGIHTVECHECSSQVPEKHATSELRIQGGEEYKVWHCSECN